MSINFNGEISCGFPSPSTDYLEAGLNLHDLVVKRPTSTFFMRVRGDSMIGAGIFPNDILVIDRSLTARNDSIVVASLNGEFTLKRLRFQNGSPVLFPDTPNNSKYKPIFISKEDDFQVFGVLTYNLHCHV